MQSKKPSAMDNDADFNIKDVEKILSPQMDSGNSNNSNNAQAKIDNVDTRTAAASISKKKWCC
jgi:hypothetical protein